MKTDKGTEFTCCQYKNANPVTQAAIQAIVDAVAKRYATLDVIASEHCKVTVEQEQKTKEL